MRQLPITTEYSTCPWCKKGTLQYVAESPRADTYACDNCGKAVWWRGLDKKPRKIQYLKYPAMIKDRETEQNLLSYFRQKGRWKGLSECQKKLLEQIIELEKRGEKIILLKPARSFGLTILNKIIKKYYKEL